MIKKYTILFIVLLLFIMGWIFMSPPLKTNEHKVNSNIPEHVSSITHKTEKKISLSSNENNFLPKKNNILVVNKLTIESLLNCYKTNNCPVDKDNLNDPKADLFLREKLIINKLDKVIKVAQDGNITQESMEKLAIDVINDEYATGGTQAKAVSLLAYLEPSEEIKNTLLNMLTDTYYDSITASTALLELRRYSLEDNKITDKLTNIISVGSSSLKESVSKDILPFISNDNIEIYKNTLKKLPPNSTARFNLESNIKEYELRNNNG